METGARCDDAAELCPVCDGEEKVASGSGESLGEGKVVRESSVSCSRVPSRSQPFPKKKTMFVF